MKITCRQTGYTFLLDSGADCSAIPYKGKNSEVINSDLVNISGDKIKCYGYVNLNIDLGLGKKYNHEFIKADINEPILGTDFICKNGIIIDIKNARIMDGEKNISRREIIHTNAIKSIKFTNDPNIEAIISKFSSVTRNDCGPVKIKHKYEHKIDAIDRIVTCKARRVSPQMKEIQRNKINELLDRKLISHSNSEYGSPMHMVLKKDRDLNNPRIVIDYIELNKAIRSDNYPVETLADFVNNLHGKQIFSALDIKDGYWSVPLRICDRHLTTMVTAVGAFEWNVMPQGLKTSSSGFSRFMNIALRNVEWFDDKGECHKVSIFCYIDDILISSSSKEEHYRDLEAVLERLREYGLKLSTHKCQFAKDSITFLGHEIFKDGYSAEKSKVQAIKDFKRPKTKGELKKIFRNSAVL